MAIITPLKKIFNWQTASEKIPYRVYTALLTQVGTNPPTAIVLQNTLGFNPYYVYNNVGDYSLVYDQNYCFPKNKTYVYVGNGDLLGADAASYTMTSYTNNGLFIENAIEMGCITGLVPSNQIFVNTTIEIRVYN